MNAYKPLVVATLAFTGCLFLAAVAWFIHPLIGVTFIGIAFLVAAVFAARLYGYIE